MQYDVVTGSTDNLTRKGSKSNWKSYTVYGLVTIVIGFIIGILIGRYATCPSDAVQLQQEGVFLKGASEKIIQDGDPKISQMLIDGVNADNIRNYLR